MGRSVTRPLMRMLGLTSPTLLDNPNVVPATMFGSSQHASLQTRLYWKASLLLIKLPLSANQRTKELYDIASFVVVCHGVSDW